MSIAVDIHAHALAPGVEELVAGHPGHLAERSRLLRTFGAPSLQHNVEMAGQHWREAMHDTGIRLGAMDTAGISLQLISISPAQYHSWADPGLASAIAMEANAAIRKIVIEAPTRFAGLGQVAWQHPELAAQQLKDLMSEEHFVGIQVGTNPGTLSLASGRFDLLWQVAEETRAIVFIHPWGCDLGDRLDQYYMGNVVGNPVETTTALTQLVFGGALDRYPDLNIVAAHGGGYFPHYLGRADHAWHVRPESRTTRALPSSYRHHIFYDSVIHDPRELRSLIAAVGAERVVLGTDYPFDMGVTDPLTLIAEATSEASQTDRITHRNLLAILQSQRND